MLDAFELASRLLDRWLEKIGPDGKARLHSIGAGKSIRVRTSAGSLDALLAIGASQISLRPFATGPSRPSPGGSPPGPAPAPDLDVEISMAIVAAPVLRLDPRQWRERGWLKIKGDINFAEQLLEISGDLPAGFGDFSEPFIGKPGAMALDRALGFIREVFAQAVDNLRQDTVDYLQYDRRVLADAHSVAETVQQCGELDAALDGIERRLDKLES